MTDPLTYRADPLDFRQKMVPGRISVMWPSRHRVKMATEALASLLDNATEGNISFGIAYDADDPDTGAWAAEQGLFAWRAPVRLGWKGLGTYFARLSELSAGEWLVWWGDDGRMLTKGWDEVIRQQRPGILQVTGKTFDGVYPVVHRSALTAIGETIPSPFVDSWLWEAGKWSDCLWRVPVEVLEDRFDQTGRNRDQVWEEGSIHCYDEAWNEYCSPRMWARRMQHAWRVNGALGPQEGWPGMPMMGHDPA